MTLENSLNNLNHATININSSTYKVPQQLTSKLGKTTIIGREKELEEIDKLLDSFHSLLINGIGGIGKSTIASYYLYSQKENFNYYGFFEGLDSFVSELREPLNLSLQQRKEDDTFIEALSKLRKLDGNKLLVFDDIKESEVNRDRIEKILALKDSGYKILFTSREEIEDIEHYYLDVLSLEDAKKLFNSIYKVEDERLLEEVLNYLDCHAFFIEKLALTLKLRKNTLSIEDIKEKFKNGEFSKIRIKSKKNKKEEENIGKLLDELFTFDELDNEDILLLKQLSIFPSIEIPYRELEIFFNKEDDKDFEDLLNFLVSKGWLYNYNNSYKLHQIIKEYILEKHTPTTEEINSIVLFFANMIENSDIQTAKLLQGYIVYFEEIIYILSRLKVKFNEKIVEFFNNLGKVYYYLGEYKKAKPFLYKVMEIREKVLGKNHPCTASSYNNLAGLYKSQGEYSKAELLYKKDLKIREKILGKNHIDTTTSYNNLANLYNLKGEYSKAEPLLKKALKIREKLLGENHTDTATSYNNLAGLYHLQGEYSKAEPLFKKALKIYKEVFGENHLDTATTYNNLASLYQLQGKYSKAEFLCKEALKITEEILGENHPYTVSNYNNLASLYNSQKEYSKAELLYKKALKIRENILGENHPDTASIYSNLAGLYDSQKEYSKAELLFKKALKIRKEVLGENHPDTVMSYNNLAGLYHSQKEYSKAEPLLKKALKIRENILGKNHTDTAISYNNLGYLYDLQKEYSKAESLYKKALKIRKEVLGENHPDTAISYNNLGYLYKKQKIYNKAQEFFKKCIEIVEELDYPPISIEDLKSVLSEVEKNLKKEGKAKI